MLAYEIIEVLFVSIQLDTEIDVQGYSLLLHSILCLFIS